MSKTEARKTINVALIGSGFIGGEHAKGYALAPVCCPDIEATPVRKILCDVNEERAKEKARLWGFEEWTTDYHDIIARDDIDLVDICTPEPFHAPILCDMIKAKKFYIACEKPLVSNLEEGEMILKCVEENDWDSHTAVSFNKRRFQAVTYARDLVAAGRLGDILMFHGRYNGGRVPEFQIPQLNPKNCSGYANCMCHLADLCSFILGDHFDEVVGVVQAAPDILPAHAPQPGEDPKSIPLEKSVAEDCGLMIAKMKSGLTATLVRESNYLGCLEDITFEVLGTKASIRWNAMDCNKLEICEGKDDKGERGFKAVHMGAMHPYGNCVPPHQGFAKGVTDQFALEVYDLVNACARGGKFSPTIKESYEILQVCEAARVSSNTRSWVKVDDMWTSKLDPHVTTTILKD